MHFVKIETTIHYLEEHANDVPWDEVVQIILSCKNPRKKGNKFEIESSEYYILFEIKEKVIM